LSSDLAGVELESCRPGCSCRGQGPGEAVAGIDWTSDSRPVDSDAPTSVASLASTAAVLTSAPFGSEEVQGGPTDDSPWSATSTEIGAMLDAAKPVGPNPCTHNATVNRHAANPVLRVLSRTWKG